MKTLKTIEELEKAVKKGILKEHHTSLFRGYVSRKTGGNIQTYKGKFGQGYIELSPNYKSTKYSFITYYIF